MNEVPETEAFDSDAFLQSAQEGTFSAQYEQIRPGEYQGTITKVDNARKVSGTNDNGPWEINSIDVTVEVDSPEEKARLNRHTLNVVYQMRLDMDGKKLAGGTNKNVPLGKLMAATGVTPPWNWQQFIGKRVTALVYLEPDKKRDGVAYERIKAITKAKV